MPVAGGRALLVLALEGAFAAGAVIPGDQMVFGRVRIVINPLPASGTYTVYTPFGKYTFPDQVAGAKLFFTEDIGIQCPPGDFTCALASKVGPFLLPSTAPGGAEMVPVSAANPTPDTDPSHFGGVFTPTPYPGTGKKYIADPARIGQVTGSTLAPFVSAADNNTYNHNIFRVEGPGLVLSTYDFNLVGRVFEGALPGRVTVDRASYARSTAANKVDVFATGLPSTQARIPAGLVPGQVTPILEYFDAPCVANLDPTTGALLGWGAPAGTPHTMPGAGTSYWGQNAPTTIPTEVCVLQTNAVDANGNTVSAFFPTVLGDQVFITEALYDPVAQRLSVRANSSEELNPPTLTVPGLGTLTAGALSVGTLAPPAKVRVNSSALGSNEAQVSTGTGTTPPGPVVPVAINDIATVGEDSGPNTIAVLANDTIGGVAITGGTVTLVAFPPKGLATVNAGGTITYTPNPNASGTDSFSYTVTVGGLTSNAASVTVTITPVNDAPVAANDSFNALANQTITLPVLANDTDVDGPTDIVAAANIALTSSPAGSTFTLAPVTGGVSFRGSLPGTYTFTYQARDLGTLTSNTATATVTVAVAEQVTVTLAEFRANQGRLRITGTVSPVASPPQRIEIRWANGTNIVALVTTATADAAGNWAVDIRNATGIQDPRISGAGQVVATSPIGTRSNVLNINFR